MAQVSHISQSYFTLKGIKHEWQAPLSGCFYSFGNDGDRTSEREVSPGDLIVLGAGRTQKDAAVLKL